MASVDSLVEEIHLRDYLRVLGKRRWLILALFTVIVFSTALITFTMDPVYEATAKIVIEKENPNVVSIQEVFKVDGADSDYAQTQYEVLQSRIVARRVIDRLQLNATEEFNPQPKDDPISMVLQGIKGGVQWMKTSLHALLIPADQLHQEEIEASDTGLVDGFLSRITIDPVRNSRVVNVRFKAKNPKLAATIANEITQVYIEQGLETKLNAVQEAVSWLSKRIQDERIKVEDAQLRFQKYKEANSIITDFTSDTEQVTQQKLAQLNTRAIEAEATRVEAETRYKQTLGISGDRLDGVAEILESPVIQSIKATETSLLNTLAELSKKYGSSHPQIIAVRSELQLVQGRKAAEASKIVQSLKNNYELALAKERSLKEALSRQEQDALSLSKKSIQYGVLQRDAESAKEVFDLLVKRFKETTLTEDMKTVNVRVVDKAEVPVNPIKPKKALNLLLALVLGLVVGTGAAFFAEYLDNSLKTPEDVQRYLKVPYLGMIPAAERLTPDSPEELVVQAQPTSQISEAFRGLRTSLHFSRADQQPQIILVTSAKPKEGKTMVSMNVAVAMAQAGLKTLILDADMRRPRTHKLLGTDRNKGLANILSGVADVDDVLQSTSIPDLFVLPSGPIPPNPSELLGSQHMQRLMDALRLRFERIIIDTPPVTAVTDGSILAQYADGVVVVSRAFDTPREIARTAIEVLQKINARIFGVVLNDVNMNREGAYYYQYSYYYYYGEEGKQKRGKA